MIRVRAHEHGLFSHTLRVATLVTEYARFRGIPYQTAWYMIEGGLLHDLGKTLLPPAMLVKPKPLNEAEKQMMTLHPGIGAALLEAEGYFTPPVISIVRSHHERLDGSGYPDGLRQSTSVSVRVIAVCDAFCAMTDSRPYEGPWPELAALARLRSMPKQYDATVVDSLAEMLQAKRQGWEPGEIEVDFAPRRTRKHQRHIGLIHPRCAFFAPVYPVKISSFADEATTGVSLKEEEL